jgi:hypothetical protein
MLREFIGKLPGVQSLRKRLAHLRLPQQAHAEHQEDLRGLPASDPGIEQAIDAGVRWLSLAQDRSATKDGGVARHYSLVTGWDASHPETTAHIVPTMLAYSRLRGSDPARDRAKRMLDWLVSVQMPCGGFQGGSAGTAPAVSATFNTGQVLIGLASGAYEFGKYREAMRRAADWLVETQDADGCWRKHPAPSATAGETTSEAHVAWGLLEAARIEPDKPYAEAALSNIRWALGRQRDNGWPDPGFLADSSRPLSHTLGCALRGTIEAYRFSKDRAFLEAAQRTADGLMQAFQKDGFLAGRLRSDWSPAAKWSCLTGTVQIAHCWLMLYRYTHQTRYRDAGFMANRYVRRTMKASGATETLGGIKGSFPVSGDYGEYQYLSWATKFFVDANMIELALRLNENQPLACPAREQQASLSS